MSQCLLKCHSRGFSKRENLLESASCWRWKIYCDGEMKEHAWSWIFMKNLNLTVLVLASQIWSMLPMEIHVGELGPTTQLCKRGFPRKYGCVWKYPKIVLLNGKMTTNYQILRYLIFRQTLECPHLRPWMLILGFPGKGRLADQPFESYFLIGLGCDFRHPFRGLDDLGVQLRGGGSTGSTACQSMGVNLHWIQGEQWAPFFRWFLVIECEKGVGTNQLQEFILHVSIPCLTLKSRISDA